MYIELLTTAAAVQNDLANAYTSSGRMRELGMYFLAMNQATFEFFKYVDPPKELVDLHKAFTDWQSLGVQALRQELELEDAGEEDVTERHIQAGQEFAQALEDLAERAEGD
jgi:hypothetical protein